MRFPYFNHKNFTTHLGKKTSESPAAKLGFFMIPVEGTRQDIYEDGKVVLWSSTGGYRPLMVTRKAYNQRLTPINKDKENLPSKETPGQSLNPRK